jgi:hypothetical protein
MMVVEVVVVLDFDIVGAIRVVARELIRNSRLAYDSLSTKQKSGQVRLRHHEKSASFSKWRCCVNLLSPIKKLRNPKQNARVNSQNFFSAAGLNDYGSVGLLAPPG